MRGSVYFHKKLKFSDGDTGEKLIVLLNSPKPSDPYLFVKTTSQQKRKPATPGCIHNHLVFFIKCDGKQFLRKDTWVQLREIYEFNSAYMIKHGIDKEIIKVGDLDYLCVNQIVNCLIQCNSDDILSSHKKLLNASKTNS